MLFFVKTYMLRIVFTFFKGCLKKKNMQQRPYGLQIPKYLLYLLKYLGSIQEKFADPDMCPLIFCE